MIYTSFTGLNYYKLAVEKDRDSISTTITIIWKLGLTTVYTQELVVRARQLASVAQLVRALHRNHRAAGSIPARGPIAWPTLVICRPLLRTLYCPRSMFRFLKC